MEHQARSALMLALGLCVIVASCGPSSRGRDRSDDDDDDSADDDDGSGDDDDGPSVQGPTDILLVVDNSNSMQQIQEELAVDLAPLVSELVASEVDFQLGVTTTDVENTGNGNQGNIRSLDGADCGNPTIIHPDSQDPLGELVDLVLVGVEGTGSERGTYAAALALCKGKSEAWWSQLEDLPDQSPVKQVCSLIPSAQQGCNQGFFREGAASVVVMVSDEGDDTERLEFLPPPSELNDCILENEDDPLVGECDCRISWWVDFFEEIGQPASVVASGPTYQSLSDDVLLCDGSVTQYDGPCSPFGSPTCSIDFYQQIPCLTGGVFRPYSRQSTDACGTADFEDLVDSLRDLILPLGG